MGTAALACPVIRADGMGAGTFGARFTPPPPSPGTVPPPPPMEIMPVDVEEDMDLVDLAILSLFNLGSQIHS